MSSKVFFRSVTALFSLLALNTMAHAADDSLRTVPVALPGGEGGLGFDDLCFSPALGKVLVPGGRSGKLYLVDPGTQVVTAVAGFSFQENYHGGHGDGITSVDEGDGFIFVTDRTAKALDVVDARSQKIVASSPLASSPDYVRYLSSQREIWVTQPDEDRIEVFALSVTADQPTAKHTCFIAVQGGPESLIFDHARQCAYTHLWAGKTVVIDMQAHAIIKTWDNGCRTSRGIALDEKHGLFFAASAEGKINVLDVEHEGRVLGSADTGPGVDVISYNAALGHLYLPAAKNGTLYVLGVSKEGRLTLLAKVQTAKGSHCATCDDERNVWVCDPNAGRLLLFKDALR